MRKKGRKVGIFSYSQKQKINKNEKDLLKVTLWLVLWERDEGAEAEG